MLSGFWAGVSDQVGAINSDQTRMCGRVAAQSMIPIESPASGPNFMWEGPSNGEWARHCCLGPSLTRCSTRLSGGLAFSRPVRHVAPCASCRSFGSQSPFRGQFSVIFAPFPQKLVCGLLVVFAGFWGLLAGFVGYRCFGSNLGCFGLTVFLAGTCFFLVGSVGFKTTVSPL